jgi:hypothetical protein
MADNFRKVAQGCMRRKHAIFYIADGLPEDTKGLYGKKACDLT